MTRTRFAYVILVVLALYRTEAVGADYYWCDMICGPYESCDTQCVDGGTNITCGTYNGGPYGGMCQNDPPSCQWSSWEEYELLGMEVQSVGDWTSELGWHTDYFLAVNIGYERTNECYSPEYDCSEHYIGHPLNQEHFTSAGAVLSAYGCMWSSTCSPWGTMSCPY